MKKTIMSFLCIITFLLGIMSCQVYSQKGDRVLVNYQNYKYGIDEGTDKTDMTTDDNWDASFPVDWDQPR
ncbi:MAG: hypothetical protein A2015_16965 [Spirochaetes bacterium GWF1_31_7]|nr:MAG: hypothetical protein A2Y30_14330 [Spirochaetes bacterium GWE1_32_154]OHD50134.1 MAG: hypothetical protein A2Y29_12375 [Spirochaetes bacterium GWE2_31_10]OHD52448.1 MAG: hypothetical protein A2015_16965 [Spirochaetes bacterium GWF1_31_7]OHD80086.1 MAG: hypothetical protein A2355_12025 [Spirochaetes bacterium RIFOXYB1_FULL_32_8]HBD96093.1 hypothetical protein [Spirochaetia bacterium]